MKAKILRVGTVGVSASGHRWASGWRFDAESISICVDPTTFIAGYTFDELKEISQRPAEFVEEKTP